MPDERPTLEERLAAFEERLEAAERGRDEDDRPKRPVKNRLRRGLEAGSPTTRRTNQENDDD